MHVVLGVPVQLDPLRGPVLDVAGAVDHREAVAVPAGAEGVPLPHSVQIAQRLGTHISNLEYEDYKDGLLYNTGSFIITLWAS